MKGFEGENQHFELHLSATGNQYSSQRNAFGMSLDNLKLLGSLCVRDDQGMRDNEEGLPLL